MTESVNENNLQNDELIERELQIIVFGKPNSGKTTLINLIKNCLERDYAFRTLFANAKISIDEKNI